MFDNSIRRTPAFSCSDIIKFKKKKTDRFVVDVDNQLWLTDWRRRRLFNHKRQFVRRRLLLLTALMSNQQNYRIDEIFQSYIF